MTSMRSNVLTLRTVKRGSDNVLTIESDSPLAESPLRRQQNDELPRDEIKVEIDEPIALTAGFHDTRVSEETVLVDISQIPGATEGDIAELEVNGKRLLFVVRDGVRNAKLNQISVMSGALQNLLNLNSRSPVVVKLKEKKEVEADMVEILIKDIYLSRGDIWMWSSSLMNKCVYKSQRLTFLETIRGNISAIYKDGKKKFSGYVGEKTKFVFRSESARLVFLIQITEEMYHFQEDGEVMFHRIVNSLFPKIFKRWRDVGTHHLITIVFAANVEVKEEDLKEGQRPKKTKDYYRVVVDQVNIVHWNEIMISLRYEFANFRKDIILGNEKFLSTIKSDILNTINLASTLVVDRFRDPDLRHTTNHFIIISAGNGLFDVEYDDLLDCGKRLLNSELSVDIICLAQPPLHISPLFRYRDHNGTLHHCVPGWIDVSYWSEAVFRHSQWLPRCKIYELQMMGIMENDINDVTMEHLRPSSEHGTITEVMDDYDKSIFNDFKPKKKTSTALMSPWKISSHSTISKAEPVTNVSPIFSISKKAISSLQLLKDPNSIINADDKDFEEAILSDSKLYSSNTVRLPLPSKPNHHHHASTNRRIFSTPPRIKPTVPKLISSEDTLKSVMWTEIDNPSRQLSSDLLKNLSVGKWQDVFPKFVKRRSVKWRSLSTPSELPVTTQIFPTVSDFENNFSFQTYTITLSTELERFMNGNDLMREMIFLRLMLGFQICYGENVEKVESDDGLLLKYLPMNTSLIGSKVYLSLDEEIHRIFYDYDGTVNVQRYNRTKTQDMFKNKFNRVMIKTRYQTHYHPYDPDPMVVKPRSFRWNNFDQLLAGYEDDDDETSTEDSRKDLYRVKFVLLPNEIPKSTYLTSNDKQDILSPEETRVEGLRRLINLLHRGSIEKKGKDEIFPEINFYTGDLIAFLKEQKDLNSSAESTSASLNKDASIGEISKLLQGPNGIKLIDRRWHWKVHKKCFRGLELVNWLIDNFNDINTREDASNFGNQLMERGLFVHVENRHKFLDGHYFYRIHEDQIEKREKGDEQNDDEDNEEVKSVDTNTSKTFVLSQSLKYDLDPNKNSYRREIIKVHYDTVHNPNHCFHVRLEWMTATPKLIEDSINSWTRMCERYGLKLVETPWTELCEIPRLNPFHSFVDIRLAINPWDIMNEFYDEDLMSFNKFYYHIYLLEYSGFLMDNRASLFFKNGKSTNSSSFKFDIVYSWGKPEFKYAQYIHQTGAYIAEIRDTGDLFLAPNNTHIARVNVGVSVSTQQQAPNYVLDSQKVMLEFRSTCLDSAKLKKIFLEAKRKYFMNVDALNVNNPSPLSPNDA